MHGGDHTCSFAPTQLHIYIVMQLLTGGELLDCLHKRHSFTEAQACHLFRQLVAAVSYMHCRKVVHRDLKPEVGCLWQREKGGCVSVSCFCDAFILLVCRT